MNRKRMHSRSNQALKQLINTIDSQRNPSEDMNIRRVIDTELQQKQLFKQSFNKIQRIKSLLTRHSSHELMQQLNDIVDLLRGQRVKAKMTIQDLHRMAIQVQENDRIYRSKYKQVGTNTDGIIICEMIDKIDQNMQTDQYKQQDQNKKKTDKTKTYQSYYKIVCMIDKLKVDYRQILPSMPDLPEQYILPDVESKKTQYKVLKNQQILKLQNVFITKLANMLKQSTKAKEEDNSKNQFLEIKVRVQTEEKNKSQPINIDIYKTPQKNKIFEVKTDSSLKKSSNKSSPASLKKNISLNYTKKSEKSTNL